MCSYMTRSPVGVDADDGNDRRELVSAIARFDELCESLHDRDLPILVTGVETAEHLQLARSRDCEWAQECFLSEPTFATDTPPGAASLPA